MRIYADANQPVIRILASGQQDFTMSCSNEIWRNSTLQMNGSTQDSFRGVTGATPAPSESADQTLSLSDRLVWYHRDASSYFGTLFAAENLSGYAANYSDPWLNRTFGATILATNYSVVNPQELQSGSGTNFMVSIYPYTAQTATAANWQSQMSNLMAQVNATSEATARTNHYNWWDGFWNRSWIFVGGDTNATNVTRGCLEQRYVEACQGRGQYPIKFNGGTFTFDYNGQNGDYRAWGPGYWNQNERLLYWPRLASGDFDMMLPFFNISTNMLPLQMAATQKYYGNSGAFFPETFNIFGLYYGDDWGWNNSGGTTCGNTYINYYYVVSAFNLWGESTNSTEVSVAPSANLAVHFEGDLIANLQSQDLISSAKVWTNRTSNAQSVGNFSTIGGGNLNLVNLAWNGQTVKTLFVNSTGGNSVQSALASPVEVNSNNPVSVEAWIYPVNVSPTSCYLNYGYQGGSSSPMNEREFDYDNSGHGVISGNFGSLDTGWSTTPTVGTWHYVAVTYDGTAVSAYLDGSLDVTHVIGTPIATVQTLMQAGSAIAGTGVHGGNDPFHGYIACARAESGILTANDVAANYALGPLSTAAATMPAGLTAVAGDGEVTLNWDSSQNAPNYIVKRSNSSNGTYAVIATNLTALTFTNTGLTNGTTYYFVVSAVNQVGQSADSTPAGAQPVSLASLRLNFGISGDQMQFSWPQDHLSWMLQVQTNSPGAGLGTNWVTLPGSGATNQTTVPIDSTYGSVFFRLVSP